VSVFLFYLKTLFTVFNALLLLLALAWLARRRGGHRWSKGLLWAAGIVFLISSTPFLPKYLGEQLEKQYWPLRPDTLPAFRGPVYIHVLGSGYGLDERLPATAQLAPVAQGRLVEGLRLMRAIPNSILVCSAGSVFGYESQASVTRKAAILLGADSTRIITLDTPNTTAEEAEALALKTGRGASMILVTDAIHMPRALRLFRAQGFNPFPAPTNYRVLRAGNAPPFRWFPSLNNVFLMDLVIHEWLARLKSSS